MKINFKPGDVFYNNIEQKIYQLMKIIEDESKANYIFQFPINLRYFGSNGFFPNTQKIEFIGYTKKKSDQRFERKEI